MKSVRYWLCCFVKVVYPVATHYKNGVMQFSSVLNVCHFQARLQDCKKRLLASLASPRLS